MILFTEDSRSLCRESPVALYIHLEILLVHKAFGRDPLTTNRPNLVYLLHTTDSMFFSIRHFAILVLMLISSVSSLIGQGLVSDTARLERYKEEAEGLVRFFQYTLNTLGDSGTPAREKDIIIQESYLKFFQSPTVQIEDDLVPDRSVVTNKDVQAYLKDVDFFFRNVRIEFSDISVEHQVKEGGDLYFLVSLQRYLEGVAVGGDSIRNSQRRFIEINLDEDNRVLKIASIYTARLGEVDALVEWWDNLNDFWKDKWAGDIRVNDSLTLADIYQRDRYASLRDSLVIESSSPDSDGPDTAGVTLVGELSVFSGEGADHSAGPGMTMRTRKEPLLSASVLDDLRYLLNQRSLEFMGESELDDLSPLSMFTELRSLTIAGSSVYDLSPIRNLTYLEYLDVSGTEVRNLEPLRYATQLKEIRLSQTRVMNISGLTRFVNLRILDLSQTMVTEISGIESLTNLSDLDLTNTLVSNAEPISKLVNLERLALSLTRVTNLSPLSTLNKLTHLELEHCPVNDLRPLASCQSLSNIFLDHTEIMSLNDLRGLPALARVYCDNTMVNQAIAQQFLRQRPNVLVIFDSGRLLTWWETMPPVWQEVYMKTMEFDGMAPGRELLQKMANIEHIDVSGISAIQSLRPLEVMTSLKTLDCSRTSVASLLPLKDLLDLEELVCAQTGVSDLEPLAKLKRLTELDVSYTRVSSFSGLETVSNLKLITADSLNIQNLYHLDSLTRLTVVSLEGAPVTDSEVRRFLDARDQTLLIYQSHYLSNWWTALAPSWKSAFIQFASLPASPSSESLHRLSQSRSLSFSNNPGLSTLESLSVFRWLKHLQIESSMVRDISPLSGLSSLQTLILSQNPIEDLAPISNLKELVHLELDNTLIEDLDPLVPLRKLQVLNCNGSQVRSLKSLEYLDALSQLDISNTDVRSLAPIDGLMNLTVLECYNTKISSRTIEKFKTKHPASEVVFY